MKHFRPDYNRIQDPAGLIGEDEPVFLIRAKDRAAVATLGAYSMFAEREGAAPEFVDAVRCAARDFVEWQEAHRLEVKVPDLPKKDHA